MTVSFLKDNKDVSNRVSALSNSFNDAGYFAGSLSKVGVTVKSTGELSVDTERLTKALKDDPKSVENILGKDGFAGRTEKKVENAQRQSDKMFPSVSSMMGSSVSDAKRMYSANTVTHHSFLGRSQTSVLFRLKNMLQPSKESKLRNLTRMM